MNAKHIFHAALTTLAMGTIGASAVPAQQPSLLNPLTWFNSPNYTTPCATGNCPQQPMYRPAAYQTNYAPAVANTYYYPTSNSYPTNSYPTTLPAVGTSTCPGGVCPTGACANGQCNMNCVNGQCFPANCPNGQCFPSGGNLFNGVNSNANYAPNGSFYSPGASATSPYYTTQVSAPINYSNSPMYNPAQSGWSAPQNSLPYSGQYNPVQYNPVQYNAGQYNQGSFGGTLR